MFRKIRIDLHGVRRFMRKNSRLLLLLAVLLAGVVIGCRLFTAYGKNESAFLGDILAIRSPEKSIRAAASLLYNACFQSLLLLLVLFFCGLSACALPFIPAVPLFLGLGIGMSEAYYYSTGWKGVLVTAVFMLPPLLFKVTAVLMAASEAMRMTLLFGKGLLGADTPSTNMREDFRLYVLRFVVFALIALVGGIADVLLRMFCGALLT